MVKNFKRMKMTYAFIFPGQGGFVPGLGQEILENYNEAKEIYQEASEALSFDYAYLLKTGAEKSGLEFSKSNYAQGAIALSSYVVFKLFLKLAPKLELAPFFGHSLGEYSALLSSQAFSLKSALVVLKERNHLMSQAPSSGMLVALGLEDSFINDFCQKQQNEGKSVYAANFNCPGQVVLAGLKPDLEEAQIKLKELGAKRLLMLNMSSASHCPLLKDAALALKPVLERELNESFAPVISNATAKNYSSKEEALELLPLQLQAPLLYSSCVKNSTADILIECSGSVLGGLNKKITDKSTLSITDCASLENALNEAAR